MGAWLTTLSTENKVYFSDVLRIYDNVLVAFFTFRCVKTQIADADLDLRAVKIIIDKFILCKATLFRVA